MGLPYVVGVATKKIKMFDHLVLCVRVRNDFQQWTQMQIPNFISEFQFDNENNNNSNNNKNDDNRILATYSMMEQDKQGLWKSMKIDNTPVMLCVLREKYQIASLKPPKNIIGATKIHGITF